MQRKATQLSRLSREYMRWAFCEWALCEHKCNTAISARFSHSFAHICMSVFRQQRRRHCIAFAVGGREGGRGVVIVASLWNMGHSSCKLTRERGRRREERKDGRDRQRHAAVRKLWTDGRRVALAPSIPPTHTVTPVKRRRARVG